MDADGLNLRRLTFGESWADRATWSPAPFNEIAYAARSGPGFDIRIYDVATGQTRTITDGVRHQRKPGIFAQRPAHRVHRRRGSARRTFSRWRATARACGRLTRAGNNTYPNWSQLND